MILPYGYLVRIYFKLYFSKIYCKEICVGRQNREISMQKYKYTIIVIMLK